MAAEGPSPQDAAPLCRRQTALGEPSQGLSVCTSAVTKKGLFLLSWNLSRNPNPNCNVLTEALLGREGQALKQELPPLHAGSPGLWGCPVLCVMLSGIPRLHPLRAKNTPLTPSTCDNMYLHTSQVSPGDTASLVKNPCLEKAMEF